VRWEAWGTRLYNLRTNCYDSSQIITPMFAFIFYISVFTWKAHKYLCIYTSPHLPYPAMPHYDSASLQDAHYYTAYPGRLHPCRILVTPSCTCHMYGCAVMLLQYPGPLHGMFTSFVRLTLDRALQQRNIWNSRHLSRHLITKST